MARNDPQVNLRLPSELKDKLDGAADANKRSLTAEVTARLQSTFVEHEHAVLIRALIGFQEFLLHNMVELRLPEDIWDRLNAEARKRGWDMPKVVTTMLSAMIQQLDDGTELGKKFEAQVFSDLGISGKLPDV